MDLLTPASRYAEPYPAVMPGNVAPGNVLPASYDSFYPQGLPGQAAMANAAIIRVMVPPDAKVFFDDAPTTQTGPQRVFVTPPLVNNENRYEITVRWMENGQERRETRMVRPIPGQPPDQAVMAEIASRYDFVPL